MTTYSTYQEAKIANPELEVYQLGKGFISAGDSDKWLKCNPADHCMTVEQFLKAGHRFVKGDIVLDIDGVEVVNTMLDIDAYNDKDKRDNERFILRAAALEKPKRVKFEYVKSELSLIEKIEILKSGERLYLSAIGSTWICESDMKSWEIGSLEEKDFYRRVETEISERDEFIDMALKNLNPPQMHNSDYDVAYSLISKLFDSGKFKLVEGD